MTSDLSEGGLGLHSLIEIITKIKIIVLDEMRESSIVSSSGMFKLMVESSSGIGSGCFNLSEQKCTDLCTCVQNLCVGGKADCQGYGAGLGPRL